MGDKMFDSKQAIKQLQDKSDELDAITTNTAVRLQSAHISSDALIVVNQAARCRLEATVWGLVLVGLSQRDAEDSARRYIENDKARDRYQEVRGELMELTRALVVEALAQNCGCQKGDMPAPLLSSQDA